MSSTDLEILAEFQSESKDLIKKLVEILEECEGQFSQVERLSDFGQIVDRIMGGAKSLAMALSTPNPFLEKVGDYAAICKAVGYKTSQLKDNETLYDICVALLLDATDMLTLMVEGLTKSDVKIQDIISNTFLERLKWVSDQFGAEYRATVGFDKSPQNLEALEIEQLLKKLGVV